MIRSILFSFAAVCLVVSAACEPSGAQDTSRDEHRQPGELSRAQHDRSRQIDRHSDCTTEQHQQTTVTANEQMPEFLAAWPPVDIEVMGEGVHLSAEAFRQAEDFVRAHQSDEDALVGQRIKGARNLVFRVPAAPDIIIKSSRPQPDEEGQEKAFQSVVTRFNHARRVAGACQQLGLDRLYVPKSRLMHVNCGDQTVPIIVEQQVELPPDTISSRRQKEMFWQAQGEDLEAIYQLAELLGATGLSDMAARNLGFVQPSRSNEPDRPGAGQLALLDLDDFADRNEGVQGKSWPCCRPALLSLLRPDQMDAVVDHAERHGAQIDVQKLEALRTSQQAYEADRSALHQWQLDRGLEREPGRPIMVDPDATSVFYVAGPDVMLDEKGERMNETDRLQGRKKVLVLVLEVLNRQLTSDPSPGTNLFLHRSVEFWLQDEASRAGMNSAWVPRVPYFFADVDDLDIVLRFLQEQGHIFKYWRDGHNLVTIWA